MADSLINPINDHLQPTWYGNQRTQPKKDDEYKTKPEDIRHYQDDDAAYNRISSIWGDENMRQPQTRGGRLNNDTDYHL